MIDVIINPGKYTDYRLRSQPYHASYSMYISSLQCARSPKTSHVECTLGSMRGMIDTRQTFTHIWKESHTMHNNADVVTALENYIDGIRKRNNAIEGAINHHLCAYNSNIKFKNKNIDEEKETIAHITRNIKELSMAQKYLFVLLNDHGLSQASIAKLAHTSQARVGRIIRKLQPSLPEQPKRPSKLEKYLY